MNYKREMNFKGLICEDDVCLFVELVDIRSIVFLSPSVCLSIHSQVTYPVQAGEQTHGEAAQKLKRIHTCTYILINILAAWTLFNTPPDTLIQMHSLLKRRYKF